MDCSAMSAIISGRNSSRQSRARQTSTLLHRVARRHIRVEMERIEFTRLPPQSDSPSTANLSSTEIQSLLSGGLSVDQRKQRRLSTRLLSPHFLEKLREYLSRRHSIPHPVPRVASAY